MNLKGKRVFFSLMLGLSVAFGLNAAMTKNFYKSSSKLSTGKWVKVGVDRTGVYEISYATLREMGFSDPSKVAVFGRGGRVLSESFVTNAGVPILTDDIGAVKVIHENEKLYFYGLGPEEIVFNSSTAYDTGGYFSRKSNNIYSFRGYYFLTDSDTPEVMAEKSYSGTRIVDQGVSFVYHEIDSVQNDTRSGQLFWGERIGQPGNINREWPVEMPAALQGTGVMECHIYFNDDQFYGDNMKLSYGFKEAEPFTVDYKPTGSLYYAPHEPKLAEIGIPGQKGNIFINFPAVEMGSFANLDFWVVSYPASIPSISGNQQLVALPSVERNASVNLALPDASSWIVLDVTSPTAPERLKISQTNSTFQVGVRNNSSTPILVVFDKNKPQLQISGFESEYSQVANQDLHSYKDRGADFIIVTTEKLRPYAEQIADLHREYDGIEVVVATTEELYNEFSGGTPDPMAYRSFAKMLYFSDRKPKNMLLFGPLYGDFRGIQIERDPYEGIIAYQSPAVSVSRGAHNINDFYGMMDDKYRTDYYERNNVQIGVGILPVKFESEAKIMVDKIKNYLERTDQAYYLNRYLSIGGIGDDHTHDTQAGEIGNFIRTIDNQGTLFTPLSIDTYGNSEAQKKFFNILTEGTALFTYFGHGAEQFLGKNRYFFNAGDVFKLRNTVLPFAGFGGCLITNTDRGFRGLGETIVTSTPYGCIGTIVSARDTWSGQNYEFFKQFFICLYKSGSNSTSAHNYFPQTIGEIYGRVKHYSTYSNELAYQLLCDPALVIPTINRGVVVDQSSVNSIVPGEKLVIKGYIPNQNSSADASFNGQIVVRICEPEVTLPAASIESGENPKNLTFTYRDQQVTMAVADVKNGQFELDIHCPQALGTFKDQEAIIYLSSYDPSSKVGAAQSYNVMIGAASTTSSESLDNVAPLVEVFDFNSSDCSINLTVSDNLALNMSTNPLDKGLYLYIDGKEKSEALFVDPVLEGDRAAYSKTISLEGLSYGEHTARLKVKDAAGNVTETEIPFTYQASMAQYSIMIAESSPEATVISASGASPANATIVILSADGNEVCRKEFSNSFTWNHVDNNGNAVTPGHYKAYIIETGTGALKGHSETIDIPVI